MLGALRLECALHATEHREELAEFKWESTKGQVITNWILELGCYRKHICAGGCNDHP